MYAIYLQSKKYISHLILLSLGTVIFSGCSQSNQLEKVPEDQQPSQPTSTKRSETEVLSGASDLAQAEKMSSGSVEALNPEAKVSVAASDSETGNRILSPAQDDFDGDETVVSSEEIDAGSVLTNEMSPAGVAAEALVGASDSGQPNSMLLITQEDPVDDLRESSPITVILPNASEGVKELRSKTKEVPGEEIDSALNNAANVAIEALVDTNIYSDVEADKSIYLGEGGGPENHECWFPWHFWKICTP
jgi:hypothetical protein